MSRSERKCTWGGGGVTKLRRDNRVTAEMDRQAGPSTVKHGAIALRRDQMMVDGE